MTRPDLRFNPDPCTRLRRCSLDVCSTPQTRPSCQGDQPYSVACMPIGCALSIPPARYLHRFSSATPIISAIGNPYPQISYPDPTIRFLLTALSEPPPQY